MAWRRSAGSIPLSSTSKLVVAPPPVWQFIDPLARSATGRHALAGFVAGEGSFYTTRSRPGPKSTDRLATRFIFQLDDRRVADRPLLRAPCNPCSAASARYRTSRQRKENWHPISGYRVSSRLPTAIGAHPVLRRVPARRPQNGVSSTAGGLTSIATKHRTPNAMGPWAVHLFRTRMRQASPRTWPLPQPLLPCDRLLSSRLSSAGFVAAEGTFVVSGTPPSFTFAVALGADGRENRAHCWHAASASGTSTRIATAQGALRRRGLLSGPAS